MRANAEVQAKNLYAVARIERSLQCDDERDARYAQLPLQNVVKLTNSGGDSNQDPANSSAATYGVSRLRVR